MRQPSQILQRKRNALQKVSFPLVKAAETVGAEGLHDADVHVGVVVAQEDFAIERDEAGKAVEIVIEELLAKFGGQVGFGVVEERGDVVLQGAFAAALIVDEEGIAVAQHDVAGLEVAIEKVIAGSAEKKLGEAGEIFFKGMFVEGNAGEAEEIVFEIVEIPGDGLVIEAGVGIADAVVQVAASFDLEARETATTLR